MEAEDDEFENAYNAASSPPRRPRSICGDCSRPGPVCLCKSLPAQPIPTQTQIIILHHPHEAQHKLSTTPVLTKCLANSTAIVSRRLKPGLSPLLDQSPSAIYLFPPSKSSPSVSLSRLRIPDQSAPVVVVAFDATWKHAKEMVRASEGFLSKFARRVSLDVDEDVRGGSIYDSELILRKEPFGGCVSTMEAVARALRVLEPNGLEIESKLIRVLRDMVALQAGFLKPVKHRPKLLKKGKEEQRLKDESSESSPIVGEGQSLSFG
ncbi:tRNA-uridine aminocarboxypropyltransferase A [Rosa rugosa]|uniref:tRNA-uridine aminocarboxypropyltransferase A n=1 Tax=Rosa rugosa TaxID=74645 RepID=UPI002B40EF0C|nr:tRNA-uridine aminocarboxypropyltransferase A [Rosa rugosa]